LAVLALAVLALAAIALAVLALAAVALAARVPDASESGHGVPPLNCPDQVILLHLGEA
jgi:hypothetical protein